MTQSLHNPALHRTALLTAAATFPLIFMGGLVTTHGAGMAVPDWPNSYGYNMVLFPPGQWVGGIWYEHVHRLYATGVGFLAVMLALFAWGPAAHRRHRLGLGRLALGCAALTAASAAVLASAGIRSDFGQRFQHVAVGFGSLALVLGVAWMARAKEPRRWVRWLAVAVLGAVIFQGVLGGLRVVWVELDLAVVHGCFAQAFFCLAALAALVTSRWWIDAPELLPPPSNPAAGRRLTTLAAACVIAIFAQLVVGATMRHYDAGLAIPDLPLAYGKLLPPTDAAGLKSANAARAWEAGLKPVTLAQIWLHFGHRIGAVIVTALVAALVTVVLRRHRARQALVWPAVVLTVLTLTQVTLGVLTVLYRKPADVASAHVAVGALVLVTTFVIAVASARVHARGRPAAYGPAARGLAAAPGRHERLPDERLADETHESVPVLTAQTTA